MTPLFSFSVLILQLTCLFLIQERRIYKRDAVRLVYSRHL